MLESDLLYLRAAVDLAERGLYSAAPNPRVGCIIVRDGVVIGRGWHVRTGEGHAEVNAIRDAHGDVAGSTVYTSLEPCAFEGRTPSCAQTLVANRVARVVSALTDPHPKVSGAGYAILREAGIAVDCAELEDAALMNAGYIRRVQGERPLIRIKVAASIDGRTAMQSGESQWITGAEARSDVQQWRARSCAIVTGAGTVRIDDPQLTVRDERFRVDGDIRQPLRVIADSRASTAAEAKIFEVGGEVLIAAAGSAPAQHPRATVFRTAGMRVDLEALLAHLIVRGTNEILVEAGAELTGAFLTARLWDELVVYLAPKLLGSTARPLAGLPIERMAEAIEGTIESFTPLGDDLRVVLTRQ